MNTNFLRFALVMLITLTGVSVPRAQSAVQSDSRAASKTFITEPINVDTPTGTLYGTLERPQSTTPSPVVLIISGSGPTDRDGNSPVFKGPNNSLKLLAQGLATNGIASVRYDKRAAGETGKAMMLAAEKAKIKLREEDLSFETFIDDAVEWGKKLRADRRFSSLVVLGHSEGSLIGMVAAERVGADAFVSVAGAGRHIHQLILEQVKPHLTPELLKTTEDILEQLLAGKRVESVPPALHVLFRPSVQPYMISWLRYDPVKEIAKLRLPVLIMQGTTDIQVSLEDAKRLAGANPSAKLIVIEGMNHVLKAVPGEQDKQVSSYSDPTLPVVPELISGLSSFVIKAQEERTSQSN
jgi:pimeloyl-ACP methyl ester carboxylesterase